MLMVRGLSNMAWLAVNENGQEVISQTKLVRWDFGDGRGNWDSQDGNTTVFLPKGAIEKLIGRKLSWDDDVVQIK